MNREMLVGRILEDEGIRGDLSDDAAQALVEWLVRRAEVILGKSKTESAAQKQRVRAGMLVRLENRLHQQRFRLAGAGRASEETVLCGRRVELLLLRERRVA